MLKKIPSTIFLVLLAFFAFSQSAKAADIDPEFNPENIISDAELLDYSSMQLSDIQNFLSQKNSYLANYHTFNSHGTPDKSAAEMIYDATHQNYDCSGIDLGDSPTEADKKAHCRIITTVNPKLLLVLLQKEQGLIEKANPSQSSLDWATGYGCPDSLACNPYYKGLGKQINSASLQFLAYVNEQQRYPYKAGQTYNFSNSSGTIINTPMSVTPQNRATAALYNYTPHVFNGNYNFFKLWKKYFPTTKTFYPDGTLLQVEGDAGVWLLENGKKRPFLSAGAFASRFNKSQVVKTTNDILNNYEKGAGIKFPNYSLVSDPSKTIFLIVDSTKRPIANMNAFKKIGFNKEEIIPATTEELSGYQTGTEITATTTYATGAILQDKKSGLRFYVENGQKFPITDKAILTYKFSDRKITKVDSKELAKYKTGSQVLFGDGTLLSSPSSPTIYMIANGRKRPFASDDVFLKMGYNLENVITVTPQLLYIYDMGLPIQFAN
ncbi:MAG: hypothetical protein NT165_01250 [Candidatus Falkowbacteria bacterium]|nr:hypothetical protein [Candidatus Falkowbacteria bacterium]